MKFHIVLLLSILFCIALFSAFPASAQSKMAGGKTYIHDEGSWFLEEGSRRFRVVEGILTVRFAAEIPDSEIPGMLASLGLEEIRHNRLGFYDVRAPQGSLSFEVAERVTLDSRIAEAFPACYGEYVTDDPSFGSQWNMHNTGSSGGTPDADIDAPEAWTIATGNPGIIVAPLDSGIDYHHNDLGPNIWQNLGEDFDHDGQTLIDSGSQWVYDTGDLNGVDDDGNGMIDDLIGWDPENNNNEVMDSMGHGTHVSGIVGARTNNARNVAGVAGGWDNQPGVSIMMVQVGDFYPNGAILDDAIIYAVDNGARVITMSLSVSETSAINAAFDYARDNEVFVNCSAGNNYGGGCSYPATYPTVVAVSATTRNDTLASFSAQGPNVEISAPGDDITSTMPGQSQGSMSGTSMASPHIAGTAGLLLSVNPGLDRDALLFAITSTADDLGAAGWDPQFGEGRLNLFNAVQFVASQSLLRADTFTISAQTGGSIQFTLNAGFAHAGRPYLLLASISGTSPGTSIGSTTLPLNWDEISRLSFALANTSLLTNTLGHLGGLGIDTATFNPGPGLLLPGVGITVHFAYILGDPIDLASNPVPILIVN